MFVLKTQDMPADPKQGVGRRVYVFRDDVLHVIEPWNDSFTASHNHRNAALRSLCLTSGVRNWTPHRILGAVAVPGHDFWVVVVEEGE